jgi:hypothetical protein
MIETVVVLTVSGIVAYFWIMEWRIDDQIR